MTEPSKKKYPHKATRILIAIFLAAAGFSITYGVLEASTSHVTNLYRHYNNQGYELVQKGTPELGIPYLKQAVALNPNHIVARNNLANAYRAQKNYGKAKAEWQSLLAQYPNTFVALVGLGNIASDENKYDKAINYYERAIKVDASYAIVFFNLGNAYYNKHDFKHAIAAYEKSLVGNPNFAETHYNLSQAYIRADDDLNALKHLESARKLDPQIGAEKNLMAKMTP